MCGFLCCGWVCLLNLLFDCIGPPVGVNISEVLLGGVTTLGGGPGDEVKGVVSGADVGATLNGM